MQLFYNKTNEMHSFLKVIFGIELALASSQHNLYDVHLLLCVRYLTPDDGQKTCLKHVEFYSKNKFEKLVHLFGFIISIYHDARSSECQKHAANSRFSRFCERAQIVLRSFFKFEICSDVSRWEA